MSWLGTVPGVMVPSRAAQCRGRGRAEHHGPEPAPWRPLAGTGPFIGAGTREDADWLADRERGRQTLTLTH